MINKQVYKAFNSYLTDIRLKRKLEFERNGNGLEKYDTILKSNISRCKTLFECFY